MFQEGDTNHRNGADTPIFAIREIEVVGRKDKKRKERDMEYGRKTRGEGREKELEEKERKKGKRSEEL